MKKKKRKYDEVNYWESMADSMVGLLLCILLITMLLILYLVRIPDEEFVDPDPGDSYEKYDDADDGGGNHTNGVDEEGDAWDGNENEQNENNGGNGGAGGNGGGSGSGESEGQNSFVDPDPGIGEEGSDKAAVLVQVVDGETGRTIKKAGVEFELYGSNSALQVLSTYYPVKTDFKKFETDKTGVFYLPEKLALSTYSLHDLTTITGYDIADNTEFTLEDSYDWVEPYIVTVSLYPSKNTIHMKLVDQDNGDPVTGATFEVVAANDIVTQDGTTRYKEGDVVDTIVLDEKGQGESKELYLGNYLLRQKKIPTYYAKITQDTAVEVKSRSEAKQNETTELTEEKTEVSVLLTDALYDTTYISGAGFSLSTDDGTFVKRYTTDEKGRFTITNLKKNTTYRIRQVSAISDYVMDNEDYSFTVSGEGLIEGEKEKIIQIKNRMIRISVGVRDRLFRGQVSDINVALMDSSGNLIQSWNTTGLEQTIEGLTPGEYQIIFEGNKEQAQKIVVEDKVEIQEFQFELWTTADIGAIAGLLVAAAGLIAFLITIRKRARNKKAEDME